MPVIQATAALTLSRAESSPGKIEETLPRIEFPLYSNPFFNDTHEVAGDPTCREAVDLQIRWRILHATVMRIRFRHWYSLLSHGVLYAATMVAATMAADRAFPGRSIALFASWTVAGVAVLHLLANTILIWRVKTAEKRLRGEMQSSQDEISAQSVTRYETWLSGLREHDFDRFTKILEWHQREKILAATVRTASASERSATAAQAAAVAAAMTAWNTTVIRNNQSNPGKFFP
jgi:hypothetical protein